MRILYLNHNVAWSGGTFFRAYAFGRHLAGLGHEVTLLTVSASARAGFHTETRDGVEIVHTPDVLWGVGRTGWDPWDALRRCAWVGERRWDIIHAWDSRPVAILPALWAMRRARGRKPPLVLDWCDWWGRGGTQAERHQAWMSAIAPLETFFEEHFRTRAHGSTVISRALFERAASLGVVVSTIRLMPQGCDVNVQPVDRNAARRQLGLDVHGGVLLSVGALQKGDASLLFETLRRLFDRCPDCRFFLIGRHGATVPRELAAHPQFVDAGWVSAEQLRQYVAASDGLLVPLADTLASRARWPSKVNTVLPVGRAVAVTRVGDLPALLAEHDAAVVVPPTAEALAEGAVRLLGDRDLRERCECRAKQVASTLLAWPRLANELDDFYETILQSC